MRPRAWFYRNGGPLVAFGLMVMLAMVFVGPFLWSVFSSFKGEDEILKYPPSLLPKVWHPENYVQVFTEAPFAQYVYNTVKIVVLNVTGGVLSASLVAYAFARFRWPARDFFFMLAMGTMMLPREVTTIPMYILFSKIKWIDTHYPLFVPAWFGGGAFMIFLFRQYIMSLPRELDEAAYMDGANPFRVFRSILLPLCTPILATAVVITFIGVWSDFWGPFIYLSSRENYTISLGLKQFASEAVRMTGMGKVTQHLMMAAMVISMVPCLVLFLFTQRYFVKSMVHAGLKGV